jgi:hypothetical protein
MNQNGFAD